MDLGGLMFQLSKPTLIRILMSTLMPTSMLTWMWMLQHSEKVTDGVG